MSTTKQFQGNFYKQQKRLWKITTNKLLPENFFFGENWQQVIPSLILFFHKKHSGSTAVILTIDHSFNKPLESPVARNFESEEIQKLLIKKSSFERSKWYLKINK